MIKIKNTLFVVIEVNDDKQTKMGNPYPRLEKLMKEYFDINKFIYYWNPYRSDNDDG